MLLLMNASRRPNVKKEKRDEDSPGIITSYV